jgi:hypothetical protein
MQTWTTNVRLPTGDFQAQVGFEALYILAAAEVVNPFSFEYKIFESHHSIVDIHQATVPSPLIPACWVAVNEV